MKEIAELRERLSHADIEAASLPLKDPAAKIGSEYERIGHEVRASRFKLQD
jgi:hypothetical protein